MSQLRIKTKTEVITQSSQDETRWIFRLLKPDKDGRDSYSLNADIEYILNTYEDKAVSITYI